MNDGSNMSKSEDRTQKTSNFTDKKHDYLRVINYQFDLEILQKWREVYVIEEEIERGSYLRNLLEKILLNEHIYGFGITGLVSRDHSNESSSSAWESQRMTPVNDQAEISNHTLSFGTNAAEEYVSNTSNVSPMSRRVTTRFQNSRSLSSSRSSTPTEGRHIQSALGGQPMHHFDVKADGVIVRLHCPKCGADKFRSILGFLNHCRINCGLVFSSQEERLQLCGIPVEPDQVPPNYFGFRHPSFLKQESDLAQIRATIQGPHLSYERKPNIRVYRDGNSEQLLDIDSESFEQQSDVAEVSSKGRHFIHKEDVSEVTNPTKQSKLILAEKGESGENSLLSTTIYSPIPSRKLLPTSLAPHSARIDQLESRFYQRKRVLIGNVAKSINFLSGTGYDTQLEAFLGDPIKAKNTPPSHQWKVYVRLASSGEKDSISSSVIEIWSFVKSVRFILHPSYHPFDKIELFEPPFELVRLGWGEFPVKVELFFWDERNRPAEFVHFLRLRHSTSGRYSGGAEQIYDVDLDRETEFRNAQDLFSSLSSGSKSKFANPPLSQQTSSAYAGLTDHDLLAIFSRNYPLFAADSSGNPQISYNRVFSISEWTKMSPDQKVEMEMERAHALHAELVRRCGSFSLEPEMIAEWCRQHGLTPAVDTFVSHDEVDEDFDEANDISQCEAEFENFKVGDFVTGRTITVDELAQLKYCRYCGLAHFPQDRFDVLQKNCSIKPRKLHLSSRSMASELFEKYQMPLDNVNALTTFDRNSQQERKIADGLEDDEDCEIWSESEIASDLESRVQKSQIDSRIERKWMRDRMEELDLTRGTGDMRTHVALLQSLRCFLSDFVKHAIEQIPDSIEKTVGRPILLTPVHLYLAATGSPPGSVSGGTSTVASSPMVSPNLLRFDFLTNAHMSGNLVSGGSNVASKSSLSSFSVT